MSMSDDVVIVSAARTPVGSFNGAFATTISVPSPSRPRWSARASSRAGCPKSSWARS
jgi:hypothetical protein